MNQGFKGNVAVDTAGDTYVDSNRVMLLQLWAILRLRDKMFHASCFMRVAMRIAYIYRLSAEAIDLGPVTC